MGKNTQWRHNRRKRLFDEQNGLCYWCGLPMILNPTIRIGTLSCTVDHLKPKGELPLGEARPAVAAHGACNWQRHHDPVPPPEAAKKVKLALWRYQQMNEI
jgi:hypothetical protein